MKLTVLGSGSTGNAVLIVAGETRVLVDAGLSAKRLRAGSRSSVKTCKNSMPFWSRMNMRPRRRPARVVCARRLSVYISARTSDAYISERTTSTTKSLENAPRRSRIVSSNRIEPGFSHRRDRLPSVHIPHDAVDNLASRRRTRRKDCDVMDFGQITTLVSERLRGCAAVVIESNHSRDMLKLATPIPGN